MTEQTPGRELIERIRRAQERVDAYSYRPTTDDIRDAAARNLGPGAFDAWLAAHDREVAAAAWWEGAEAQWKHRPVGNRVLESENPHREGRTDA
jgi:hypothetical protein